MFGQSSHNAADRASIDTTALRNLNLRRLLELMDYQHHSDLLSCGRVGTNRAFIQIQRMPVATPKQRSNLRSDVKLIDRGHKSQFRSSVWPRYCERPRTVPDRKSTRLNSS